MKQVWFIGVACVAFLCSTGRSAAPLVPHASVASPTLTGPILATAAPGDPSHQYPFFATPLDLGSRGYVEEEYFFEGTASRFDIPAPTLSVANTPQTTATVVQSGLPYRTRMIIRRPAAAEDFNGTVFMEWQNVTFGFDVDALWLATSEHLMRRGYAWVGVSVQRAGVNGPTGLRAWSPARYGGPDLTTGLDLTAGGTVLDDSLGYDIFSQAAQALRSPIGADPMPGFSIERIIAVGVSQGATRLVAYQNAVHPLAGVFDGFMPALLGGFVRADSTAKAFKVLAEGDVARDQAAYRQPNTDRFRRWEIAGASHIDFYEASAVGPIMARDVGSPLRGNCTLPPFSRIPARYVMNASLDAMVDWVEHGTEPPMAPDLEVAATGLPGFFTAAIARDSLGNALGGIRLAEHAVPTATNTGINGPATGACRTYGSYEPFDQATLDALYGDHGAYVGQVSRVTQGNVKAGFVLREDAMVTIETAAQSEIGKRPRR